MSFNYTHLNLHLVLPVLWAYNDILISVCISLIHNEVEHIFVYLLAISVSSSGNMKHLLMSFAHFFFFLVTLFLIEL